MASVIQSNFRVRKNLGRVRQIIEVPNLIDIQKSSYDKFLQTNVPPGTRVEVGAQLLSLVPSHHDHAIGERIGIRIEPDHVVAFERMSDG